MVGTQTATQPGPHQTRLRHRAQSIPRGISRGAARIRCRVECGFGLQQDHGTTETEIEIAQRLHIH